ncbi:MAG: hypothetical protein Udaeo2_17140 [Candidatus Udaeobacter sp.]|nr:MAG: hypothetical protein Udaeo2_17140 [Candidatus Udaeobacter sp.]
MLKSGLKYAAIAKSGAEAELSDAEAAQVIRKQAKQRQDSIEALKKAAVQNWRKGERGTLDLKRIFAAANERR